jgi:hypothetical protein
VDAIHQEMSGTYLEAICPPVYVVGGVGYCLWFALESVEKAVRAAHGPIQTNYLTRPRAWTTSKTSKSRARERCHGVSEGIEKFYYPELDEFEYKKYVARIIVQSLLLDFQEENREVIDGFI